MKEKFSKVNILPRVEVFLATFGAQLATNQLHLQYFFQNFIFTVHDAMTSSIFGKTHYRVISSPFLGSPSHYFLLSTMQHVWNEVGLCTDGLEILIF